MTALHHRLENLRILDRDAGDVLTRLLARVVERPAGTLLYTEGCPVESTRILLQGWAIRYRTTADGERQVLNFLLPGDSIGLYGALFERSSAGVELVTDARLAEFPCTRLMDVFRESARLGAALCWIGGMDERFLEQQIFRLGALNATERIAHLVLELQRRWMNAGASAAEATTLPLSQRLIGEALSITHVHVSRCCRRLSRRGLLETASDGITLLDPSALASMCGFDLKTPTIERLPKKAVSRLLGD